MDSAGVGVSQHFVQAHKWIDLAASHYDAADAEEIELATMHRDLTAARMSPAQLDEARKLSQEWTPTQ